MGNEDKVKQDDQPDSVKPSEEEFRRALQPLTERIDLLSLKLQKQELQRGLETEDKKPWWSTAIQFLALPAAVLAILLQAGNVLSVAPDRDKTLAEAAKTRAETLKTQAELELLLDQIAGKRGEGVKAYQEEIERTLPQLRETLARLDALVRPRSLFEELFPKYIILWALFLGVALIFQILQQFWSLGLSSATALIFASDKPPSERRKRARRVFSVAVPILHPLPNLLDWAIRVVIFGALVVPLFDEVATALGSDFTFSSVWESARELNFGEAVSRVKVILFGRGGSI
jgi:hypothetical protein